MKPYRGSLHKYKSCKKEMHCVNDSGEFQEVESNESAKFSHVPSQPAEIPSPRSMQSCDKRLPPDTCNLSELQENVFFANPRSTLESSQTPYREIAWRIVENLTVWFDPNVPTIRRIDFFWRTTLEHTTQLNTLFQWNNSVSATVAILASGFRRVFQAYGRVP